MPNLTNTDMTKLKNEFLMDESIYRSLSKESTQLTDDERNGIMQMREEEKMAGDVYFYFYDAYKVDIFKRIAESEVQHSDAVLSLIKHYKIKDPAKNEKGKFTHPGIQNLYTELTQAGSTLEGALNTGAFIEEYDIADLKKLIANTNNEDIKRIYTNLMLGSHAHLRGFAKELTLLGTTYEPRILDQGEYKSIMGK